MKIRRRTPKAALQAELVELSNASEQGPSHGIQIDSETGKTNNERVMDRLLELALQDQDLALSVKAAAKYLERTMGRPRVQPEPTQEESGRTREDEMKIIHRIITGIEAEDVEDADWEQDQEQKQLPGPDGSTQYPSQS